MVSSAALTPDCVRSSIGRCLRPRSNCSCAIRSASHGAMRSAGNNRIPPKSRSRSTRSPFGGLVHGVLEQTVNGLEANGGFGRAARSEIEKAVAEAAATVADAWEREQPVPPPVIWRSTLERAEHAALIALTHPLESLPQQKSWTEIPFGTQDRASRNDLPWDPAREVEIPSAGVFIQGHIDRLDLSGDGSRARVIDYKTGQAEGEDGGGRDQGGQRTPTLPLRLRSQDIARPQHQGRGGASSIHRRRRASRRCFRLQDVDAALEQLADAIALARRNIEAGLALPGIDAE